MYRRHSFNYLFSFLCETRALHIGVPLPGQPEGIRCVLLLRACHFAVVHWDIWSLWPVATVAVKCLNREPKKDLVLLESPVFQWFSVAAFPDGWCWLMLVDSCYFRQLCCSRHQYGRSCQSHRKFCNWAGASVLSLRCFITCPLWIWRSYGKSPCLI